MCLLTIKQPTILHDINSDWADRKNERCYIDINGSDRMKGIRLMHFLKWNGSDNLKNMKRSRTKCFSIFLESKVGVCSKSKVGVCAQGLQYGNIYNFTGPQEQTIMVDILIRHIYNKDKCRQFEGCTNCIQDCLHTKHKTSKFPRIWDFLKEVYKKVKAVIENVRETNYIYKLGKT